MFNIRNRAQQLISFLSEVFSNAYLLFVLAIAIFVFYATQENHHARLLGIGLLALLWAIGARPAAEAILRPLEGRYQQPEITALEKGGAHQIVVLTGGGYPVRGELLSSAFPHASAYRLMAGIELCARLGPGCALVFSGSAGRRNRNRPTAEMMKDLALVIHPEWRVIAESHSGSTGEHPANVAKLLREGPFLLVTSALHMTRSVRTFRRAGLDPIPYPVDYLATGRFGLGDLLPSAKHIWVLGAAIREYQALLFYTVWGR